MDINSKNRGEAQLKIEEVIIAELQSLYRYACYRLGSIDEAQDIIHELYLKLHAQDTRHIRNLRCYIYRALSNSCTQRARNHSRLNFVDVTTLNDLRVEDMSPTNFEQEQTLMQRLLTTIPEDQSEVIRLHLHGECTFVEIAEILDIPLATAKSRYRYGIEHLRKELQKQNLF